MLNQFTLAALLDILGDVYQTVDVRAAIVRDAEQWLPIALSIHLRTASCDTAKQEIQQTEAKFGAIDSPVFRIVQQCWPAQEIKQLAQQLLQQKLTVSGIEIQITPNQADILSRTGYEPSSDPYKETRDWPLLESMAQVSSNPRVQQLIHQDSTILRDLANAGYADPHAAVRTFLTIPFESNSSPGHLWLRADIPVRLRPIVVTRSGKEFQLSLTVEAHPDIEDLSVTVRHTKGRGEPLIHQKIIKLTAGSEKEGKQFWSGKASIVLEDKKDEVTLQVFHSEIGQMYSVDERPFELLPREQANPLIAVLERFCPRNDIRALLEHPQTAKLGGKAPNLGKPEKLFEVSVQWLLSALGFRAVWLHAFETLQIQSENLGEADDRRETKAVKFKGPSVDCLAYSDSEDILLLVNCTVAAPNPSELTRQADLTIQLAKDFADSKIRVESVLFSASHTPETRHAQYLVAGVRVLYQEDIAQLLDIAVSGRPFRYAEFFDPLFRGWSI